MRRRDRGQVTVEVALALPVVVVTLLLVIQVALVARAQVLVVHTAREGARAGAVEHTDTAVWVAVRATPGLRTDRVRLRTELSPDSPVRVTVRYRMPTGVPLVGRLLGDPELTATVVMHREDTDADP